MTLQCAILLLGTVQWDWAGVWIYAVLEEPGHNDRDFLAQWKQIKDAQLLTGNLLTTCSAQQTRPTVGRTQQPKLRKCPDIRPYIVFTSTKRPNPRFPSSDSPLSASPTPCISVSTLVVAFPTASAFLSPGSEAVLQLISLNRQASWCTSHVR